MDLEQLSRNNEDKKETISDKISRDYYENFLREQVNYLENLLKEKCNREIDETALLSKIIAYQECYVQYLLSKR